MALKDWKRYKFTIAGDEYSVYCYVNNELYDATVNVENHNLGYIDNTNLEGAMNFLNSIFQDAVPFASNFPFYSTNTVLNNAVLAIFHNAVPVNELYQNGISIEDSDGVSRHTLFTSNVGEYYLQGSYNYYTNFYNWGFSAPFGVKSHMSTSSVYKPSISFYFPLLSSNNIVEGRLSGIIKLIYVTIAYSGEQYNVSVDTQSVNGHLISSDGTPIEEYQPSDPFAPGGTSEAGGGGGTFDDDSDEIPDSSLPTLSAANTGFTRIYNPTLSQVQAMANYLWTDDSVIETIWNHIKQFLEDPMDAFIAFNLVPCVVPNGGTSNFKVMYIDTGVAMTAAANQFVDVDCGTVQLDRYYGSALDYTPYTRVGCFLPYIGTVELDTDEVMGATLQVKYRIDIVSGACVAKIFVDGTCLYQYSGHCAINIPFTSADFSNYVNAIIQVAKAGLIAASGVPITSASAGEAAEQLTGRTVTTTKTTRRNPATGRQIVTGTETTERDIYSTEASFKGLSPSNLANTVGAVMGSKPMIEHSGGFNGNSGYLGIRRPFLIIKRPRMCNPSGYGMLNGYPCMIKETLGNLSGFTQVQQVQLTGLSATNPEQAEILQLLKQGVIL